MKVRTSTVEVEHHDFIFGDEGGVQIGTHPCLLLHGSPEDMDRLAAAAVQSAERQRSPRRACDGGDLPEGEYPYGSATGTAA